MSDLPLVSTIIPCRNEQRFIGKCLDSIIAQDYPKDKLEILVVDGMSEDGTRSIVEKYAQKYSFIKLFDNPGKITPVAFNIGIKNAKGEIIMIMSAHATYENDYISKCVKYLKEFNADNVGGIWKILSRDDTFVAKAIIRTLSHPFGVGNAYYRISGHKEPRWVDTAAYGCYKREVFEKIGLFNEKLVHTQDMEFNLRLKNAGGRTLLIPDAIVYYYARSDFKSFCRHNFANGIWVILPFKFTDHMPISLRHLVPLVFVSSLIGFGVLSFFFTFFLWLFLFIIILYGLTDIYFSGKIAIQKKDIRCLFIMPVIFISLHISYGLGSIYGMLKASVSKRFWGNLRTILRRQK